MSRGCLGSSLGKRESLVQFLEAVADPLGIAKRNGERGGKVGGRGGLEGGQVVEALNDEHGVEGGEDLELDDALHELMEG